ncbi:thioredoxin-dependent thiol peroxidase [Capnocytophaga canimorsus]|uniref:thioredoxin-dependent thiol peroxidase n=1 Tax=Capnocytophaga canimorsus TaxID=28188 RepID=UPI000BB1770C|nr:thioredoxin-dependent thiol peroxidase [Capnocytophaga canimorsus]ATA76396.1 thioredoxin-dependent thiol peroxidase [Capnocytophaga canimorsus]PJI79611.1 peroxiredoxin Q/BCP [Capnocytophaga canimorsus]STA71536.1 Putative peroxiredoxin bcp [Capnocytophaga canimorsus]
MKSLQIGEVIPDFSGIDQNGNPIKLSDYKQRKGIIFFYPKASTPGCTAEVCNLRDGHEILKKQGFFLLGISADSVKRQLNFAEKNQLPFPLIADENREIIELFGVWGQKKFMGKVFDGIHRKTFIIDENHQITHIIDKVQTKNHTQQILSLVS